MKARLLSSTPSKKPRSLDNPEMVITASDTAWLSEAKLRHPLDLTLKGDREVARRFATRIRDLSDYWEAQQL